MGGGKGGRTADTRTGGRCRGRKRGKTYQKVMTRVHVGMLRYINLNPNSNLVLSFSRLR